MSLSGIVEIPRLSAKKRLAQSQRGQGLKSRSETEVSEDDGFENAGVKVAFMRRAHREQPSTCSRGLFSKYVISKNNK